jgi:hypothetical protein
METTADLYTRRQLSCEAGNSWVSWSGVTSSPLLPSHPLPRIKRFIIFHGRAGWIQEVVAEGDDVWLIRLLAKSAEVLSSIRVQGDLVKVWFRSIVMIARTEHEILPIVIRVAMLGHEVG